MVFAKFTSLALFVGTAIAAPAAQLLSIGKVDGDTTGRYIVTLKDYATQSSALSKFSSFRSSGALNITHEWDASFLNGFAGMFFVSRDSVHFVDYSTASQASLTMLPWLSCVPTLMSSPSPRMA